MAGLVLLIIFGAITFAIAHFLGRKRQIGFGWSFFFCLFLSPIIGFIVTMLSRKYYDENPAPSNGKKIWGWILIIFFSWGLLVTLVLVGSGNGDAKALRGLFLAIGFIGLGYYLIELGKGKNFNKEEITKAE